MRRKSRVKVNKAKLESNLAGAWVFFLKVVFACGIVWAFNRWLGPIL